MASKADAEDDITASLPSMPEKKRRRPALACEQCRKRKIKCNRTSPCTNCIKAKIEPCTYAPTHVTANRVKKSASGDKAKHDQVIERPIRPALTVSGDEETLRESFHGPSNSSSISSSARGSASQAHNVDALLWRIRQLEQKLAQNATSISLSSEDHIKEKEYEPQASMKGTLSRTLFYGQSHWMNGAELFPNVMKLVGQSSQLNGQTGTLAQCKNIGRSIKAKRHIPLCSSELGTTIPQRKLADQLVDIYFNTFEGVIRILHRPSFRAEYDRYWQNPDAASDIFVMQLQLCMAIGACMYDDVFSLRTAAVRWVLEAQMWFFLPPEKSKMTIAGIQILCMLVTAKATCGLGQELTWITTGALLRQAMYMGLHRDPSCLSDMSVFRAEMRRRLWTTVLELNLQASLDLGGQPLISSQHHDTRPPANLNDDELTDEPESARLPPEGEDTDKLTDMSVQLALHQSLQLRHNILQYVSQLHGSDSYSGTLRLNSDLSKACRQMYRRLANLTLSQKSSSSPPRLTSFHSSLAQVFLYRCFLSLHQPMVCRSLTDPTFYYSRKVSLDCSLRLAQICGISAQRLENADACWTDAPAGPPVDAGIALDRLITNGAGMFRNIPIQTLFSIGLELNKREEEQQHHDAPRADMGTSELRGVLDIALRWMERRIRSGETNVKGHCFLAACISQAKAIGANGGEDEDGIQAVVIKAAEESCSRSLEMLKEVAEREGVMVAEDTPVTVDSVESMLDFGFDWMSGDFCWDGLEGTMV